MTTQAPHWYTRQQLGVAFMAGMLPRMNAKNNSMRCLTMDVAKSIFDMAIPELVACTYATTCPCVHSRAPRCNRVHFYDEDENGERGDPMNGPCTNEDTLILLQLVGGHKNFMDTNKGYSLATIKNNPHTLLMVTTFGDLPALPAAVYYHMEKEVMRMLDICGDAYVNTYMPGNISTLFLEDKTTLLDMAIMIASNPKNDPLVSALIHRGAVIK